MTWFEGDRPHQAAKAALRSTVRQLVSAIPAHRRILADERIRAGLSRTLGSMKADFVVGYLALRDEPVVDAFLCEALERGAEVLLPRVADAGLEFGRWWPCLGLVRDRSNVLAPSSEAVPIPPGQGMLLVPGRAFDDAGGRLGRGGGYYDAVLASLGDGIATFGVAYEEQMVERVPSDPVDRRVDAVVTQERLVSVPDHGTA